MNDVAFRVEAFASRDVDRSLCALGELRLERSANGVVVEVARDLARTAAVALGRAGLRCDRVALAEPPRDAIAALVSDLAPLTVTGLTDRIWVRVAELSEATRRARRGILRRRYDAVRVRAYLRGEEHAYAWRRVVWLPRALLRAPELRRVRPVVFDRSAVSGGPERWASTRSGLLERWLVP